MVGGEHDDDRVGRAARGEARRDGDRRTRVAARRLQHDVGLRADLAQLVGDEEAVIEIGDDDRPLERRVSQHRHRRLEGGALARSSGMNCLGSVSRDSGHTRVPDPPHIITGKIFFISPSQHSARARPRAAIIVTPDYWQYDGEAKGRSASASLFALLLKFGLERRKLGEGRIRIGLALASLRRGCARTRAAGARSRRRAAGATLKPACRRPDRPSASRADASRRASPGRSPRGGSAWGRASRDSPSRGGSCRDGSPPVSARRACARLHGRRCCGTWRCGRQTSISTAASAASTAGASSDAAAEASTCSADERTSPRPARS